MRIERNLVRVEEQPAVKDLLNRGVVEHWSEFRPKITQRIIEEGDKFALGLRHYEKRISARVIKITCHAQVSPLFFPPERGDSLLLPLVVAAMAISDQAFPMDRGGA